MTDRERLEEIRRNWVTWPGEDKDIAAMLRVILEVAELADSLKERLTRLERRVGEYLL